MFGVKDLTKESDTAICKRTAQLVVLQYDKTEIQEIIQEAYKWLPLFVAGQLHRQIELARVEMGIKYG